jgi:hypothetical protein
VENEAAGQRRSFINGRRSVPILLVSFHEFSDYDGRVRASFNGAPTTCDKSLCIKVKKKRRPIASFVVTVHLCGRQAFVGAGKKVSSFIWQRRQTQVSCEMRWRWVHLHADRPGEAAHALRRIKRRAQEEFISSSHIEYHSFLYELACADASSYSFHVFFFNASHPRTRAGRKKSKYGPSRRGTFIDICIWWCASLCVWCLRVFDAKNKKENCTCRHARHVLWFLPFGDDLTVASDSSPVPRIKYSTNSFFVRDVHFNGPADAADENVLTVGAGGIEWPVRMKRNSVGPPLNLMLIVSLLLRTGIIRKVDGVHTEHAKVLSTHPRPPAGRRLDRARLLFVAAAPRAVTCSRH